jgi:hypothetical protein
MVARRDQVANRLQQMYSAAQARGAYAAHQAHGTPGSAGPASQHAGVGRSQAGQVAAGGLDLVSEK